MEIRGMTLADYEAVYRLWKSTPGMGLNDRDDSREGISRYLKRNPDTCFVAAEKGRIVGVILCGHDGRRGYIHHTAVAVDWRGRGVGSGLVDAAMAALKEAGISKAALVVFARNELGNRFWEGRGFAAREDLAYRDRAIQTLVRMDT